MISGFSFTSNDYESILMNASDILPGIEKIVCVYYEPQEENIKAISLEKPDENKFAETLQIIDRRNEILKSRTLRSPFTWISREEVPFTMNRSYTTQANIFKEQENVVLLLRYTNPSDKLSDLIYIYLKKNFGNFGLGNATKVLSADNKQIIASLLFNAFKNLISTNRKNRLMLKKMNHINHALLSETEKLKSENARIRSGFSDSIISLCKQIAGEISAETAKKISFSEDAIGKLKHFNGNIKSLYLIIRNSVEYASVLHFDERNDEILIKEQYLMFDNIDIQEYKHEIKQDEQDKYDKTIELLDKLENAARTVVSRNYKLTSANVGKYCPQPISAPAITDALKKHRKKVVYLLERYPGKWDLLKREFKPLQNLIVTAEADVKTA